MALQSKIILYVWKDSDIVEVEAVAVSRLPHWMNIPVLDKISHQMRKVRTNVADDIRVTEIELVIGADYYYDFIKCPKIGAITVIPGKVGILLTSS